MFTKTLRLLSLVITAAGVASWVNSLQQRRIHRQQKDSLDKARWEDEGGATRPRTEPSTESHASKFY
jgi:hypothetical protein